MIERGKANVIIGGQWGSEGKGKLAGYLYNKYPEINVAVSDFTPNTGHTYVDAIGKPHVSKILPIGTVFESVDLVLIGPHAVINVEKFQDEHNRFRHSGNNAAIAIHPLASVLTSKDVADEQRTMSKISSTMQGSIPAQISKMTRDPSVCHFAKDDQVLQSIVADTALLVQERLRRGDTVLIETGQGFDLSLNHGHEWPYTTGRDCMIGRSLDSAGISPKQIGSIITALRTYPIRVGSVPGGSSGPYHSDQDEINWDMLSEHIGRRVLEMTTVTKRVRRVFTWSDKQVSRMCNIIHPDYAFLNFVNYLSSSEYDPIIKRIGELLDRYGCKLKLLGTGASLNAMEELQ